MSLLLLLKIRYYVITCETLETSYNFFFSFFVEETSDNTTCFLSIPVLPKEKRKKKSILILTKLLFIINAYIYLSISLVKCDKDEVEKGIDLFTSDLMFELS